jgi:hypothetical protein
MNQRSMFAVYLYEDADGNISVRADSYGQGEKVMSLGMNILDAIATMNQKCGGDCLMLPIDRSECVQ